MPLCFQAISTSYKTRKLQFWKIIEHGRKILLDECVVILGCFCQLLRHNIQA
jgi:hypothetical protein